MIDPLMPFRIATWWAGLTFGLAYEASKLLATTRSRPVTPTREALAAELAAMPKAETFVPPKTSVADDREARKLAKAVKDALSANPVTRMKGEAALKAYAAKPTAAARKRRS